MRLSVLVFVNIVQPAVFVSVICNFGFKEHNNVYTCDVDNRTLFNQPHVRVDAIVGTHVDDMEANEVVAFNINAIPNVKYVPQNIDRFFRSLKNIQIVYANLLFVYQLDLKPFPRLQFLNLNYNQLTVIEKDLLLYNTELERLWLSNNRISHIDPMVFTHLYRLHVLSLTRNSCSGHFHIAFNRLEVKNYTRRIESGECLNLKVHMEIYEHTMVRMNQIKNSDPSLCRQALENDEEISQKVDKVANTVMCVALLTLALLIAFAGACALAFIRSRKKKTAVAEQEVAVELREIDSFDESFENDHYEKVRGDSACA